MKLTTIALSSQQLNARRECGTGELQRKLDHQVVMSEVAFGCSDKFQL